jgi:RHS repeat-associated protein
VTWTHTYDANGERVWSWDSAGAGRTDLFSGRDSSGRLLREFKKVAPATTTTAEDYIYLGNRLLATVKPNEEVRHMDVDHLGTVRLVTSATGAQLRQHHLWPYGEEFSSQDDDEQMRFTGHERDLWATTASTEAEAAEDDLDYMHARYYRPLLGRFLSVDPVGGNARDPRSWNRYSYVLGNPLRLLDLDGQKEADAFSVYFVRVNLVFSNADKATLSGQSLRGRTEAGLTGARQLFTGAGIALSVKRFEAQGEVALTPSGVQGRGVGRDGPEPLSALPGLTVLVSGDSPRSGGTVGAGGPSIVGVLSNQNTLGDELSHALGVNLPGGANPFSNALADLLIGFNQWLTKNALPLDTWFEEIVREGAARQACAAGAPGCPGGR